MIFIHPVENGYAGAKCSDSEYTCNGAPWEWLPLEVAAHGSGGPKPQAYPPHT